MEKQPVLFLGAGPGDPELITVKGMLALKEADLVLYAGSLVPEAVTEWAREGARRVSSAGMHLDEIVDMMKEAWSTGLRVVRLHSGDPSLYGAITEQIARLEAEGIGCRIIPGVTAAFAAAAALGVEYTLPETCQTLIFTRISGRTRVPGAEDLDSLAAHQASLAVYLSSGMADRVAPVLERHYGKDAPVVVAYRVSQPGQRLIWTTPAELAETMERHGIDRQALIIAGKTLVGPGGANLASRLYDKTYSHDFRASSPDCAEPGSWNGP
ncbi:MAG: precorrin-4 C(11)-methyltransferase [Desulfatibacillaceae bacterium]